MRRLTLIFLANFVLLTLSLPPSANAQSAGSALNRWTRTGDLTAARSGACAAILNDGRLLVAGGLGDSGSVAAVDIYGTDGAFMAGAPMTHARARAACVTLADGRVLVAGGNDGSGSLNSAEIFDPSMNQWQPTGNLSVAREGHQMAMTSWGFAWVAGGNSNGAITGTLELFNPDTGQFQAVGALNTARAEFAMTPVGRSLVIAGGTDGSNTLSSVEIYDGSLGTLTVAGKMSQARKDFAAAALLDGTILMTGGVDVNGATLSSTEIFDPVKGTSATGPALLEPRAYHSAYAMAHNGSVLIYGGTGNSIVLGTTELYMPWTGSIAQGTALNSARRDEAKAGLRAGSYMIVGGRNEAGFLSGSELFQFSTISTDKGDYAPGTAVKISGGGWVPGEQVLVTLTAFPIDQHHIEFTGAAVADGAGNISVSGFAVDKSHLGMKFLMSAVGSQSQAQATFTDGIDPIISYTFSPASGTAAPGTAVTVTVTFTPPNPASPTPTGPFIPCTAGACPTTLTVSGASCNSTPLCTLSAGAGNTAIASFNMSFPAGTTTFSIEYQGDSNYNFELPTSGTTPPGAPLVNYTSQNFTVTDLTGGPVSPANFGTQTPYVANVCIAATSGAACIGSGTLSGKVQFFVNGVASGSPVPIVATGSNTGRGTASFIPNPPLAIGGPYLIIATYGNDLGNAGSTSTAANGGAASISTTIIGKIDPIISYTFNPASGAAAPGTPVTVTVTLTPPSPANPTPTGTIIPCSPVLACPTTLTVSGAHCNSTPLCTLSPGAGNTATVSFTISFPAGTTTFSIEYSGDGNYNFEVPTSGATPPGAPVVNYTAQNFTVTDLTGGPVSPANFGTQTPYVANVCIAATSGGACLGSGTLSGKVQFFVNGVASGSPVPIVPTGSNTGRGTASFIPNPPLAVGGPYVITAMYGNDLGNVGAASTAANGGAASISTTIIGKVDPTISYTFNPASGAATPGTPVTVTVTLTPPSPSNPTPTGTIIPCSPVLACPTTLTVSGAHCNSTPLCTLSPGAGNTATVSFTILFPAGTTTFSIEYSGDGNYNLEVPTSGATPPGAPVVNYTETVTSPIPAGSSAGSSLAVTVSPNPAQVNQAITISINVIGTNGGTSTPTGTVTLSDNGVVIGVNPVLAAIATFTVTLGPGSHTITAVYSGDSIYPGSSASYGLTVAKPAPTTTFTASSSISVFGQPVTLSATLKGSTGSPTPTGTVQFLSNGVPLGSPVTLANGVATLTTSSLPPGANLIAVQYSGDSNFSSSTVNGGTVTVSQAQVTTTLAVTTNGAQMTLTATLAVVSPGSGTPTGTVRFIDTVTGAVLSTATVSGGSASVTIPVTSDPIVAVYSGDANFLPSTSSSAMAATITALNAASDVAAFSADAIISIYGSALTSQTVSGTLPLQSTLGGITVTVTDSSGVPRQALLFFVSPGQINLLIPAGTATGPATITVNTASGSLTTIINIAASTAALFTASNNGAGPLAAQIVAVTPSGQQAYTDTAALTGTTFVNSPISFSPAADTFYLLLYGTGFDTAKTVTVSINGRTFTPAYFGPQGGFAGLDQVNVLLPASMAGSGQVNVSITVDGRTSNVGTVAFGATGTN